VRAVDSGDLASREGLVLALERSKSRLAFPCIDALEVACGFADPERPATPPTRRLKSAINPDFRAFSGILE